MRHQKIGRKLGRNSSHRRAMMRNLVTSLIVHERITTTDSKAKELRRVAERLVTKAARVSHLTGDKRLSQADRARLVHARRVAARHLRARAADANQQDVDVIWKLFEDIGPRFAERQGGYLRITKLPALRKGDAAPMSIVEFVVGPAEGKAATEGAPARAGAKPGGLLQGILGRRRGRKAEPAREEPEDEEDGDEDEGKK